MLILTISTEDLILQFLEEMESLIDADDGTVFQMQHIDMIEEIMERIASSHSLEEEELVK